jgi:hypothetical protein
MDNSTQSDLLNRFTDANQRLVQMGAEIKISEIEYDRDGNLCDPPLKQIEVWHPFIFDNRLVPSSFEGVIVLNLTWSNSLPWITRPNDSTPLWEAESPHNYVCFVNSNIETIRSQLKMDHLTKEEALNAITGGFANYLVYWHELVQKFFK